MDSSPEINFSSWSHDLDTMIHQVRHDTLRMISIGLGIASLALLGMIGYLVDVKWVWINVVALLCLGGAVRIVQNWNYTVAAAVLVSGFVGFIFSAAYWGGISTAVFLFVLPAGLATLLFNRLTGALVAVGVSGLILFAPIFPPEILVLHKFITILLSWLVMGMVLISFQPLLSTLRWAWYGYQHSRDLLEKAREAQVHQIQTMEQIKEANTQMNRLNRLAQSMRLVAEEQRQIKEQFVASVSHELRTPLNMIIGFCEMITQSPASYGVSLPAPLLADLSVVLRNSQHLSGLIDDVLDLSQIEAGQMVLSKEWISFNEIVQSSVIAVRPLYESKGLSINLDLVENLPLVFCDRTRIREVFLNLLSNAGRFTEEGGVTIRVRQEEANVLVQVRDTGKGISAEVQKRLFEPFQQADTSIQKRYGGSGLGLSISKRFIELHDGSIWVNSEEGRGAEFSFRLPLVPPLPVSPGALQWLNPYEPYEERASRSPLPTIPILPRVGIIERDDTLKRTLARQWMGIELVTWKSIEQALEDVKENPAGLILINRVVENSAKSDLSGLDFPPNLPVVEVQITGSQIVAEQYGAVQYLLKPISPHQLIDAVHQVDRPVKTILLADDELDVLQLFSRVLAGQGYRVLRANHGRQALDMVRLEQPDLVILDRMMPEMDGLEVLAHVRGDPSTADIPVIIASARDPLTGPISTPNLRLSLRDGISVPLLFECLNAIMMALAKHGLSTFPAQPEKPAG
jgi:signal transduction histidine kinase/CheY-like chemotaxis protein